MNAWKKALAAGFRRAAMTLGALLVPLGIYGCMASARLPDTFYATGERGSFSLAGNPLLSVSPSGVQSAAPTSGRMKNNASENEIKLFGAVPIKKVRVETIQRSTVTLCGTPFGLKLYTDGALVVGFVEVDGAQGTCCPGQTAGLRVGDVIRSVNGTKIRSNQDAAAQFSHSSGQAVSLTVDRGEEQLTMTLTPQYSQSSGTYKAGLWIKDSCAGIGTLTFTTTDGRFAGLGHGITDGDTGELMPVEYGEIVPVTLVGIHKGVRGTPGELRGYFSSNEAQGTLMGNRLNGVYGTLHGSTGTQQIEVAFRQEVHRGAAQLFTTVENGDTRWFDVEIERICYDESAQTQNMVVHITDEELLSLTGGIVQGMSGSPLVQDGRLIGAVTHVFVHDPTRGYAIFAESMAASVQELTPASGALAG